jgi:ABC-2 type transport system ATP-binding protein
MAAGMTEILLELRGVKAGYEAIEVLHGVSFQIPRGSVFAMLGPNGAGKTTTVEILEGYRARDGGAVAVLGYDPGRQRAPLKRKIGIVLQSTGVEPYLTVTETVRMYAGFYPNPRPVDEVISLVGLEEKRDSRVNKLSGGSSGGSTWRSPWPATRSCSSSTSRPPGSTPRPGARPGK